VSYSILVFWVQCDTKSDIHMNVLNCVIICILYKLWDFYVPFGTVQESYGLKVWRGIKIRILQNFAVDIKYRNLIFMLIA
jgi:hypothetical protein